MAPLAAALLTSACGKSEAPAPSPNAASSTSAPATAADPANAPAETPAADEANDNKLVPPDTVVAKVAFTAGERSVTYAEVAAYAEKVKATDKVRYPDTFEDLVARVLLADEARRNGKTGSDDVALGEAWMKEAITPDAEKAVSDADVAAAFAERRSAARVMFRSEDEAKALRAELVAADSAFQKAPDVAAKVVIFKTKNGKNEKLAARMDDKGVAPSGVLFDPQGKGDTGQAVVPAKIAEKAYQLAADGDVSEPFELAPGRWALVMRTGTRPGTPLEKVPPDMVQRTRDGLVAAKAIQLMRERVARLRREAPVTVVEEGAITKALGLDREASRMSKLRKVPLEQRRNRLNDGIRGPRERHQNLEPREVPRPDQLTPEKAQDGMPEGGLQK